MYDETARWSDENVDDEDQSAESVMVNRPLLKNDFLQHWLERGGDETSEEQDEEDDESDKSSSKPKRFSRRFSKLFKSLIMPRTEKLIDQSKVGEPLAVTDETQISIEHSEVASTSEQTVDDSTPSDEVSVNIDHDLPEGEAVQPKSDVVEITPEIFSDSQSPDQEIIDQAEPITPFEHTESQPSPIANNTTGNESMRRERAEYTGYTRIRDSANEIKPPPVTQEKTEKKSAPIKKEKKPKVFAKVADMLKIDRFSNKRDKKLSDRITTLENTTSDLESYQHEGRELTAMHKSEEASPLDKRSTSKESVVRSEEIQKEAPKFGKLERQEIIKEQTEEREPASSELPELVQAMEATDAPQLEKEFDRRHEIMDESGQPDTQEKMPRSREPSRVLPAPVSIASVIRDKQQMFEQANQSPTKTQPDAESEVYRESIKSGVIVGLLVATICIIAGILGALSS